MGRGTGVPEGVLLVLTGQTSVRKSGRRLGLWTSVPSCDGNGPGVSNIVEFPFFRVKTLGFP